MDLSQLRNFTVVAEHLHFGRAAAAAGVSTSTLSRQIGELEQDLGFKLFDRSRRQVALTPAGAAYLVEVRAALHQLRSAAVDAGRIAHGELRRLRIGHGDAIGMYLLQAALPELRRAHPDVRLEVTEAPSVELIEGLSGRTLDIALLRPPVNAAGVDHEALGDERLVVALPASHRLTRRRTVTIEEVKGEVLVVPHRATAPAAFDTVMSLFADAPNDRIEEGNTATSINLLVAAGLGVAVTPAYSTRHFGPEVEVRQLSGRSATLAVHVAWRREQSGEVVTDLRAALAAAARAEAARPGTGFEVAPGLAEEPGDGELAS